MLIRTICRRMKWIVAALFWYGGATMLPVVPSYAEDATEGPLITMRYEKSPLELVIPAIIAPTKMNVVVDSQVKGTVTLNLKDVPWEQGLDLILKTNELDKRQVGNTLVIARKDTIAKNFDKGLTKTYPLRYAKAQEMQTLLTSLLGKETAGQVSVQVEKRLNALVISTTEDMFKRVEELLDKLDRPVPQVMIDVKIVEVSSDFAKTMGFSWNWGTGEEASAGENAGTGNVLQFTEYAKTIQNGDQYDQPSSPTGMGLFDFGDFYRKNMYFNAVFSALVETGESRMLSSPRVIAMNGQKASLTIGREVTYSGGTDQAPESKDTGTIVNITPQINNDGYIVLEIDLEKSTVQQSAAGGLPTVDKTNVKTTLQVQDGEEILVGGIVEEQETHGVSKIPFLSNLPFIKHLFTRETTSPKSKEIVILITPKIVKQSVATSDFGELVANSGSSEIPNTNSFNSTPTTPAQGGGGSMGNPNDIFVDDGGFGNDFNF
jgi:type IV pilus assembly protein PilQ